jgi:propanediol dehydratase large subunit
MNFTGETMAKRSAALTRAEKALSGARKRATDLRKKMKTQQPMEIAATVGGGYLAGFIEKETPVWVANIAGEQNPSLLIGGGLVAYGMFSARAGQAEKMASAVGTGFLTVYAYNLAKEA